MIPKFRAWEPETKYMNDQVRVTSNRFGSDEVWVEATESFGWIELKPEHLMQSTGLKDKNGVEIFEGDIGWDDHQEVHGQVIFENGAFKYEWENISEDLFEVTDDIEIVGNIYENSELLEGSE
ncbi:DNA-packaging protein [Enterococcus faecalis]|uniref:YopX family protein n=1 Tax=Enterococcus faecalis TaxID=1351 RepID=UPI001A05AA10|nr:YopX family protein [Enterococcus faecalis]EGO2730832.1 DNA-packaging protein [Enterococcus faecalis]EJB2781613.1 DNA-packaging protein [Enterococcus faecalis]EJC3117124.1 DNA-packaging protein [Enterococcus faecalis]EJR6290811.1 DNA-packaging protein [Enterococcus faecalis]EKZ0421353.1 DNA-packaging protein [Enterococcus faecalis]